MATWETGTAEFTCKQCGAKYVADYKDFPVKDSGEFKCEKCGALVHSWRGTRDYFEFKLVGE